MEHPIFGSPITACRRQTHDPAKIHNCDSSMDIYVKRDERDWEHYSSMCGEYKSEGGIWNLMDLKSPTFGASEMQLGFLYQVQNVQEPDPSAVLLSR